MVSADSVYNNMASAANCRTSASREVLSTRGTQTEKPECAYIDASAQTVNQDPSGQVEDDAMVSQVLVCCRQCPM